MSPTHTAILLILALGCSGCAHIFSDEILKDVDRDLTFEVVRQDPTAHEGESILLGGVIVDVFNREADTRLEIYETELDAWGKPVKLDQSRGRFFAFCEGFLDAEIYRQGRRITLVGTVTGTETVKVDEAEVVFPCITVRHLHLWKPEPVVIRVNNWGCNCGWCWPHYRYRYYYGYRCGP